MDFIGANEFIYEVKVKYYNEDLLFIHLIKVSSCVLGDPITSGRVWQQVGCVVLFTVDLIPQSTLEGGLGPP